MIFFFYSRQKVYLIRATFDAFLAQFPSRNIRRQKDQSIAGKCKSNLQRNNNV